jgi:hypothetical protein
MMSLAVCCLWLSDRVVAGHCGCPEVRLYLAHGRVASYPGLWSLLCVVSFFARGIGPTFLLFNIMIHNSYACSKSAFMIYELSKSLSMICKWHCADDKVK